jgi:hypothetical protein
MEQDVDPGVSALAVAFANGDENAAAALLRGRAGEDVIRPAATDPVLSALVVLVTGFATLVNSLGTERAGSAEVWSTNLRDRLAPAESGDPAVRRDGHDPSGCDTS